MIQIRRPKYEHDNYCTCCRKPFDDSMEVSFSHKDYNDSVNITLCGKCRRELMEALSKADSNSSLDHIHNVVAENAFDKGYDAGHKEGYERGRADAAISARKLVKHLTANYDDVLSVADVLEELEALEAVAKGE